MTFEENARLKAETISQLTGKTVLADDSWAQSRCAWWSTRRLSVCFAGVGATENNAKLLHELAMVFDSRTAQRNFTQPWSWLVQVRKAWLSKLTGQVTLTLKSKGENGLVKIRLFLSRRNW